MKIRIQMVIEDDDHADQPKIEEIVCLERDTERLSIERLGLSLSESKEILAGVQTALITHQAEEFMEQHRCCQECGAAYYKNGMHQLTVRTLFGTVKLTSQPSTPAYVRAERNHPRRAREEALVLWRNTSLSEPPQSFAMCKPSGHL